MINNPFKKEDSSGKQEQQEGQSVDVAAANAPPALQAFTSRFLSRKSVQLSPDEIAQKIATLLRPGPPFYSKVQNSDLIANLSDASIMNSSALNPPSNNKVASSQPDSTAPWKGAGTVWTALEGLPSGNRTYEIPGSNNLSTFSNEDDDDDDDDGLWSALMVTVDLDCKDVSLAKSVVVPTQVLNENNYYKGNNQALRMIGVGKEYQWDDFNTFNDSLSSSSIKVQSFKFISPSIDMWSWPSWVPFLGDHSKKEGSQPDSSSPAKSGDDSNKDKKKKRVWIPSTTKVSFRAAWWGFTIALPPPVMAALDKDAAQAEKIANTINTALNYILNHLPSTLPVTFLPIITVLKSIAPVVGYLSTFIGWSWSELKSFDQGKGIELSATWILPVALIPRSWDSPTEDPDQDPTEGQDPSTTNPPVGSTPSAPPADGPKPADPQPSAPAEPQPTTPAGPAPSTPEPTAPAPSAPATSEPAPSDPTPAKDSPAPTEPTPSPSAPVEDPVPAKDQAQDEKEKVQAGAAVPVPAPGATLPPTDPTDADLEPSVPKPKAPVLNDPLGRGGDKNPISQAPMGDSPVFEPPKGTENQQD